MAHTQRPALPDEVIYVQLPFRQQPITGVDSIDIVLLGHPDDLRNAEVRLYWR